MLSNLLLARSITLNTGDTQVQEKEKITFQRWGFQLRKGKVAGSLSTQQLTLAPDQRSNPDLVQRRREIPQEKRREAEEILSSSLERFCYSKPWEVTGRNETDGQKQSKEFLCRLQSSTRFSSVEHYLLCQKGS